MPSRPSNALPTRFAFDALLDELATTLAESPTEAITGHVGAAIGQAASLFDWDHGWLAQKPTDGGPAHASPGWAREGCAFLTPFNPAASLPWIAGHLDAGASVCLGSPDELPPEVVADRAFLEQAGIRSLAGSPIVSGGTPVGWLALATIRQEGPPSAEVVGSLGRLATVVAGPLARAQAEVALRRATEFDRTVAELAATLVRVPHDAIDAQVVRTLGAVGELLGADRASVSQLVPDAMLSRTHRWVRPGTPSQPVVDPRTSFPWMIARLFDARELIVLTRLDELPPEAAVDRATLERDHVVSGALAPMVVEDRVVGIISFASVTHEERWSPDLVARLRLVGGILASAMARQESDRALRRAVEFDQVVASLTASLIRVPAGQIDVEIVKALGVLGELLGADRAAVIQRDLEQSLLVRTHLWVRAGVSGPPRVDSLDAFPWLLSRVFDARELVALTRLDELPPEAARDRATLEQNGVGSGALAPMIIQDRVLGELMFATSTREQQWSPDLVARLRLVGEIIASALSRREVELALRDALTENERLRERLEAENVYLKAELGDARDFGEIVGRSTPLLATLERVRHVADTDAPVLLLGETGTGKELLARALHAHGPRRDRPFIAVNCAAIPPTLIESELFGYEKGAFTGATQAKPGRFELADRGTLLLDEIGDLDAALQAKLLRVLEGGELQRLGGTSTRKVDVRIIAATNRDLRRDLRDGRFRSDLYYRLAVFPIEVPPLRDRQDDIPLLVWHFIQSRNRTLNRSISRIPRAVMAALQAYDWPGNVRELQNVIERAMILSRGAVLRIDESLGPQATSRDPAERHSPAESLQDVERAHIVQTLERCRWTIEGRGQAADRLGLNPSTLRNRMRKLGIRRPAR